MPKTALVIGSGIAGLATALRLKAKGYHVIVFEKNSYPGGKLHSKKVNGYRFDLGPSLFTMPWLVTELFELHGKRPDTYFEYIKKETICNYFWEDRTRFTVKSDKEDFIEKAAILFGEDAKQIKRYLDDNKKKYELTSSIFLEKSLHKVQTYLSKKTVKALLRIGGMGIQNTMNNTNMQYFQNPKLIQLFNRYATYNGSSPYRTPGIMSMIPHLEMDLGTYFPKGGMHNITKSLYQLALDVGIVFHFNSNVDEILIENDKAIGLRLRTETVFGDMVISNMDVYPTYKKLLPEIKHPRKILNQERSSSALIFYWGIAKTFPELDLHNIMFSEDYKKEFDHIFNKKSLFEDTTVYINVTSKENREDAPEGCENWFVMINAPANHGQDWGKLAAMARKSVIRKINTILNTDIEEYIETEFVLDPIEIEQNTSSYRGALYGAASNSKLAAFLRHPNFSSKTKNLYFCGGSVHPGGGIPLCLLSSKIVNDLVPNA
ncbi:phytoene desaturase family protein [Croceitalea sp. MTPC5]|uniref:1-hydroxycarotenoid 3,4-desaturase CrtD n=1 Tax=Croceitalea sp. MTPC5 TaxID=3056565 RepID=UPI002B3BB110|nr:phytoene desaturase family protein [Croceitalea sp. MTPC5]